MSGGKIRLSRRRFLQRLGWIASGFPILQMSARARLRPAGGAPPSSEDLWEYWWYTAPSFAQIDDPALVSQIHVRMAIFGAASDPTWGPYAQHLTELEQRAHLRQLKGLGARAITWIEGFGDCMMYAVTVERRSDGAFVRREDDARTTRVMRSHWSWANPSIPQGNTFRWVGLHNTINDEDFVLPAFGRAARHLPVPRYPDGRSAVGWLPNSRYPLNARIYDACGAKDINGSLHPAFEATTGANGGPSGTGRNPRITDGLYPAIPGKDDAPTPPGMKPGDAVYCGVISVHKDLSAPFWRQYAAQSVREIVRAGLDGVWCDNYSPWDNFGYPPIQKAFGDWSVFRFHRHLLDSLSEKMQQELGVSDQFDIRHYLKNRAAAFGARDPSQYDDPAWRDVRWLDDPIWNRFKAFRQQTAKGDLQAFYQAIHGEARRGGRPDFCIGGNDIPFYGLGWVQDGWLDMVNAELTPGWHMGTGSRGIMIPPLGKMAVVYRAALEHQKGPFVAAWYYLNGPNEAHQRKPGLARVLLTEAFANGAFLMCNPTNKEMAGSVETHAWWNTFVRDRQAWFGRRVPAAEVGVLFSPDNQLAQMAPGGFPDMDRQPHVFGYYGWATALVDSHVPFRAVTDWKLDRVHLEGLRLLVIPDAAALDDKVLPAIEGWVRTGGHLLLTGSCGTRYGPRGQFARRRRSLFADVLGRDLEGDPGPLVQRALGRGHVAWIPQSAGMEYYLATDGRSARLPRLRAALGTPTLLDGMNLPVTVGVSLWRSLDREHLFIDLVNYDLDGASDVVRPAADLAFRVRLPAGWKTVRAETAEPDHAVPATIVPGGEWAEVRLPRLNQFVSIRLTEG